MEGKILKKIKDAFSIRLKRWLCSYVPLSEMVIEHGKIDLINIYGTLSSIDVHGLSDSDIELLITRQMLPEIRKYVEFVDIEMRDGTKIKQGILKVAKTK